MASDSDDTTARTENPDELLRLLERWACGVVRVHEGPGLEAVKTRLVSAAAFLPDDLHDRREALEVLSSLVDALRTLKTSGERNQHLRFLAERLSPELMSLEPLCAELAKLMPRQQGKHGREGLAAFVARVAPPVPDGRGGIRRGNYKTLEEVIALSVLGGRVKRAELVVLIRERGPIGIKAVIAWQSKRVRQAETRLLAVWRGAEKDVQIFERVKERNS